MAPKPDQQTQAESAAALQPASGAPPATVQQPSQHLADPAPIAAPKVVADRVMKPLLEKHLYEPGHRQQIWMAHAPSDTTLPDILNRDFWANVSNKLRDGDKVCVMREDRAWYCELIVFAHAHNWAVVRPLGEPVILGREAVPTADMDYEVQDGGLIEGWIVLEKKTGRKVKADGTLKTREAAENWKRQWLMAQKSQRAA